MKHAITALEIARQRAIERMRSGDTDLAAAEKNDLDAAIALLAAIGGKPLPEPLAVTSLEAVDFGPFAEYRLLWDFETERRGDWREIALRLSPGDIVITSREQFLESQERDAKSG
jgi:hypothetical protein